MQCIFDRLSCAMPATKTLDFSPPIKLYDPTVKRAAPGSVCMKRRALFATRLSRRQGGVSMLTRSKLSVVVICSLVFSLCPMLYSQANGNFSGTVADKTGSVIAGATVKITSQGTGVTREVKTDGSGHYLAPLLPVAIYTIRVESQGFQITEQKDIRLQVDEQREVDFSLNPASVSSTVEVSATEVAVETTEPTLGQVITAEQVADLPLNGRDF